MVAESASSHRLLSSPFPIATGLALGLLLAACSAEDSNIETLQAVERSSLVAGSTLEARLAPQTFHRYRVEMEEGWVLRLKVDQENVDLVVAVGRAGNAERDRFDVPVWQNAPETPCWVARASGEHVVEIAPFSGSDDSDSDDAESRAYELAVTKLGPASVLDRRCAEAHAIYRRALASEPGDKAQIFEESARAFEDADEIFQAAVTWREAGTQHVGQGEPAKAIEAYQRALELARRTQHPFLETSLLNRLGLAYRDHGDLDRAFTTLDAARRRALETDAPDALASALTNLGGLGPDLGDPFGALAPLRRAESIWRELGDRAGEARAALHLGTVLGTLDRHEEAADALERALSLARDTNDPGSIADALQARGWNAYLRGRPDAGLAPLDEALGIFERLGQRNRRIATLDRLGTLRAATGGSDGAIEAYREALALLRETPSPRDTAATSVNLARALIERGDLDEAAQHLDEGCSYYAGADDPKAAAHCAYSRAELARAEGDLARAARHVDEALARVEALRDTARDQGYAYLPIWLWRDYAALAIDLRLARHALDGEPRHLDDALEIYDRSRAWALFEQVVARRRRATSPAGPEARADELRARIRRLAATRRNLGSGDESADRLAEIEAELRRTTLELEEARAAIRRSARDTGDLGSPRAVTVREIQEHLSSGTRLLAYRLGPEGSQLFTVTREHLEVWPLADRDVLERYAEAFYRSLEASRFDDLQWRLLAESFARTLLPEGALDGETERLLVLADGLLHYVPFGALASPRRGFRLGPDTRGLGDDFEIGYLPSASVWRALDRRRPLRESAEEWAEAKIAVFADPVFHRDDERLGNLDRDSSTRSARGIAVQRLPEGPLPRLPHTADEAATLERLVDPEALESWIGFDATKSAVLGRNLRPFRILHFATHAWIDEEFPELSGLVLSRLDARSEPIDGDLYLHEIQSLDLAADLTVLSGCQTALGRHVRGNGLLGLTHGFFEAGSAQVLVTLWSVDDRATSILMEAFYERLLEAGDDPATALRAAQRALRERPGYEAPYFWAPFVLHGAP